jgi:hypothetical protein
VLVVRGTLRLNKASDAHSRGALLRACDFAAAVDGMQGCTDRGINVQERDLTLKILIFGA